MVGARFIPFSGSRTLAVCGLVLLLALPFTPSADAQSQPSIQPLFSFASASVSPSKPKMQEWLHCSPRSTPTVRRSRLGRRHVRDAFLLSSLLPHSDPVFPSVSPPVPPALLSYPAATGPRDFACFDVGALFFAELLCFFKVDLLIHCDCTVECVDHW